LLILIKIDFLNNQKELIGTYHVGKGKCIECTVPLSSKPNKIREVLSLYYTSPNDSRIPKMLLEVKDIDFQNFLCAGDRFALIKKLAFLNDVPDELEEVIIRLMKTTPTDQAKQMIDSFKKTENLPLLKELYNSINGDEDRSNFFGAFSILYFNSMTISEFKAQQDAIEESVKNYTSTECNLTIKLAERNYLVMMAPSFMGGKILYDGFFGMGDLGVNNSGEVSFLMKDKGEGGLLCLRYWATIKLKPFDLVKFVYFTNSNDMTETYMPGYCFRWALQNYDDNQIAIGVNKAILVGSIMSLGTSGGIGALVMRTIGALDIVITVGNLLILEYQDKLNETPEGQAFVQQWNTFNTVMMINSGTQLLFGIGKTIVNYRSWVASLKSKYNIWRNAHYEGFKAKYPEIAAKLEEFNLAAFRQFEHVIAKYELTVQRITRELGVSETVAKNLITNDDFLSLFNAEARILNVIKNELPSGTVNIGGVSYNSYKDALMTKIAADPSFLTSLNQEIDGALAVFNKGNLTTADFQQIANYEKNFSQKLADFGFEDRSFFNNGFFNTSVFKNAELGANGIAKINWARTNFGANGVSISASKNVMVAEFNTTNAGFKTEVAHSGTSSNQNTTPVPTNRRFGQFEVGNTDRFHDSESKFFENLFDAIRSGQYKGVTNIKVYSERAVCPSCANVINNFKKQFNIEITIFEGKIKP
jgi:hypothetical protein